MADDSKDKIFKLLEEATLDGVIVTSSLIKLIREAAQRKDFEKIITLCDVYDSISHDVMAKRHARNMIVHGGNPEKVFQVISDKQRLVSTEKDPTTLSEMEFMLFKQFVSNPGALIPIPSKTEQKAIATLRKKTGMNIINKRGEGYIFEP